MKSVIILVSLLAFSINCYAQDTNQPKYHSKYAGQETRPIKTLSQSDMKALKNGEGWGLAKAAELNGVPGPKHLLEMKKEIDLNDKQVLQLEELFFEMKSGAVPLGNKLIEAEKALNYSFASNNIDEKKLDRLLTDIYEIKKQLRYVHLVTHLKALPVVSKAQVNLYNDLRGYGDNDPCENIPPGHDPVMWKRHNNCE